MSPGLKARRYDSWGFTEHVTPGFHRPACSAGASAPASPQQFERRGQPLQPRPELFGTPAQTDSHVAGSTEEPSRHDRGIEAVPEHPFQHIPIAVHDTQQIVSDLRRRGIGVLISDHNVEQTLDIVDRAYIMYDGRDRVSGTVSELVWNDEVAEIYLGPTLTARMRQRYTHPG